MWLVCIRQLEFCQNSTQGKMKKVNPLEKADLESDRKGQRWSIVGRRLDDQRDSSGATIWRGFVEREREKGTFKKCVRWVREYHRGSYQCLDLLALPVAKFHLSLPVFQHFHITGLTFQKTISYPRVFGPRCILMISKSSIVSK